MEFRTDEYLNEMKGMVSKAIERLKKEKSDFVVYSLNIWTDPNTAASSINFDSRTNSDGKVGEANEWSKKYYEKYIAEGDVEQARLFEPNDRNRNPAEFELSDFEEQSNSSIPDNWEEGTHGFCWDLLEPALEEVGEYALAQVMKEKLHIHPEFELSVNGRKDWYQFTWSIE
jgi:hypothetical protein